MDPTPESAAPPPLMETLARASAGFWIRALARIVDFIFSLVFGFFTGIFAGITLVVLAKLGKLSPDWMANLRAHTWSFRGFGFGILGAFLYYVFCEGICGTTLGKLCCGLSTVHTDGRPCTMASAFKRGLLYHWDALFFGLIGYNSMKDSLTNQRYGDVWADTVVVKKASYAPTPPHPVWRFPVGIIVGMAFWMLCQFTAVVLKALD
jgi:uncharacterized RDD family membrane protein YckC